MSAEAVADLLRTIGDVVPCCLFEADPNENSAFKPAEVLKSLCLGESFYPVAKRGVFFSSSEEWTNTVLSSRALELVAKYLSWG